MYNAITKSHKEKETGNDINRAQGITKSKDAKNSINTEISQTIEWKEIKIYHEQHREAIQRSSIYVEIGGMRMAADADYPVTNLAALCKELLRT